MEAIIFMCLMSVLWTTNPLGFGEASHPDQFLNTPQLIQKYGYPVESHMVTTDDGYILTMHRIPYSPRSPAGGHRPAVFLQHGLFSSSADWIILGPGKSLAYLLADAGFDVWLGNCRGNTYSKQHKTLSRKTQKFWDFSWHEMGIYDVPAMLDYILEKTNQQKLYYIGHSMGTTVFFVAMSVRPEYNEKIKLSIALAPSVYFSNAGTILTKIPDISKTFLAVLKSLGTTELFPTNIALSHIAERFCTDQTEIDICTSIIFILNGHDTEQIDKSLLPVILSHAPAGASLKSLQHYRQILASDEFTQFDYGRFNMARYKRRTPPDYNLKAVTAPVSLIYGFNDEFSNPKDVMRLGGTLPNCVDTYAVPYRKFSHVDFVWAKDVKTLLNDRIINLLQRTELNSYK